MQIILKVNYSCNIRDKKDQAKYWADSYIKNKIVTYNENEISLHEVIKKELESNDCVKCAKVFKPTSEMYTNKEDGTAKQIGWIYKVKHFIEREDRHGWVEIPFDAWVEILTVSDYNF